jgi:hypothetical protein
VVGGLDATPSEHLIIPRHSTARHVRGVKLWRAAYCTEIVPFIID